jgi:hypothetical protein
VVANSQRDWKPNTKSAMPVAASASGITKKPIRYVRPLASTPRHRRSSGMNSATASNPPSSTIDEGASTWPAASAA